MPSVLFIAVLRRAVCLVNVSENIFAFVCISDDLKQNLIFNTENMANIL